ncbi:MAG TPA: ribonuclease HII [Candidatus Paceibacterota bacterium]
MKKFKFIIGIDEVGRGPIAGPVAVGTFVFLQKNAIKKFKKVKESKQLTEMQREKWFEIIEKARIEKHINFAVVFQSEKVIDKKGISFAIRKALEKSLKKLKLYPAQCLVLLDGGLKAPKEYKNQKTIIKGDVEKKVIALASICAKVLRDRKMREWGKKYPKYGFEIHKGYGTRGHYEAISKYGLVAIHRRSFLKDRILVDK